MPNSLLKLARLGDGPEIFHTLQGEGVSAGRPAVFVRLSLCNLHCRWCDTDYTWNWEGTPFAHDRDQEAGYVKYKQEEQTISLSPEDVARVVADWPTKRVVLTGGEPLLQQSGLRMLATELRSRDSSYVFEVETNGTLLPEEDLDPLMDQYNVSPKLENSGNRHALRIRPSVLAWFAASSKAWFKFVITSQDDLAEIRTIITDAGISNERVILMPEGRTPEAIATHRELVVKLCLDHGYTFNDRLHLRLFGARRGT
ncbi:MAG: 7-carboxy-7-deazaguanine synthase QueE [Verrucomicrobiales bacterium]